MPELELQEVITIIEGEDGPQSIRVGDYDISAWVPLGSEYTITSDVNAIPRITLTLCAGSIRVVRE